MDSQCSGIENIFRRGIFLNQSTQQMQSRVDDIVEFSGLGDRIRHPLYSYSSGMRARLAFSIATSIEPEILVIDEGIGTADSEFAQKASQKLDEFLSNSGILLIASHSKEIIQRFTGKTIDIDKGHVR
jgi:ABC-2 type transport system ATP-binding protein